MKSFGPNTWLANERKCKFNHGTRKRVPEDVYVVHGWQHQQHQCAQENADRANPSAGVAFAPEAYVASLYGTVTVIDTGSRRVAGA
ncbi:hypothetical protein [Bradyrhizobium sp. LMG 9283]|uniref:hypothetical protein n=1 Tax=Bradyrhizobium sp. LMG 9283 TaxID=592064 RepID=UPI00388EF9C8